MLCKICAYTDGYFDSKFCELCEKHFEIRDPGIRHLLQIVSMKVYFNLVYLIALILLIHV